MGLNKDRTLDETLSALMDNEVSELELRRLLKQLPESSPATLARWQRYHIARSALHSEPVTRQRPEVLDRILEDIAAEPAYHSGFQPAKKTAAFANPWLERSAKFAIAASVTLAVFVGLQTSLVQDSAPGAIGVEMASEQQGSPSDSPLSGMASVDADAQRRLNEYIQSVSIQYSNQAEIGTTNVFEEFPLLVPVNQIEPVSSNPAP